MPDLASPRIHQHGSRPFGLGYLALYYVSLALFFGGLLLVLIVLCVAGGNFFYQLAIMTIGPGGTHLIMVSVGFAMLFVIIVWIALNYVFFPVSLGYFPAWILRQNRVFPGRKDRALWVECMFQPSSLPWNQYLIDTADDIGYLSYSDDEISFDGMAYSVRIPTRMIREVTQVNGGWAAMWLAKRCRIQFTEPIGGKEEMLLMDRGHMIQSMFAITNRKIYSNIYYISRKAIGERETPS